MAVKPRDTGNVVKLMDGLRERLNDVVKGRASQPVKGRKPKKAASGRPKGWPDLYEFRVRFRGQF